MSAKSHVSNYVRSDQNPCDLWHEPWNPGVWIGICIMAYELIAIELASIPSHNPTNQGAKEMITAHVGDSF